MAILIQVICLIVMLGMAHSWTYPTAFDEDLPSNNLYHPIGKNLTFSSMFNDMNKMMAMMYQRFQHMLRSPSFSMDHADDWKEDRKKLDAVEPVCNKTIGSPSTTSSQKNRRKKLRNTQTTTCIKELIIDGKKQLFKETNVTDDHGVLISQSKIYQTISINTMNNTMSTNMNTDQDVISY